MTTPTVEIWIPHPPRELHPNHRSRTYHAKARATKEFRNAVAFLALEAAQARPDLGFPWPGAEMRATFVFRVRRSRDRDNLLASLKAGLDGLIDGGILVDDRGLIPLPAETEIDRGQIVPRVKLELRRRDP